MTQVARGDDRLTPRRKGRDSLPACFGHLSHPPAGLWYLGDATLLDGAPDRHVAIVGTRDSSAYGERIAAQMAQECAKVGLVVVSGLARGVDAAAHRAALAAGGSTIAVLGTGVDVPYPVGHRTLHRKIAERGLVLSEFEPGTLAGPGCFPRRNRLMAALCKVTLVVEAGLRSGAINTAGQALDLGRDVAAVPGPIDSERSAGTNQLCQDGAHVITCVDDLLRLYGFSTTRPRSADGSDRTGAIIERLAAVGPSAGAVSVRQYSEERLARELSGKEG